MTRRSILEATGLLSLAGAMPAAAQALAPAQAPLSRPMSSAAWRGWLPNVSLVAHTGETFNFYDYLVRGDRIVLLKFFVVACTTGRCPAVNQTLRKVQDMVGSRMGKDVFLYSVTPEPERDTVPILKEYAEHVFEVKPGWLFLSGCRRGWKPLPARFGDRADCHRKALG
jgi:protein SCO1/2